MIVVLYFPHSIITSLQRVDDMLKDCQPIAASLTDSASRLTPLVTGEGVAQVEQVLARDKKRLAAAEEKVRERKKKLEAQRSKSVEVSVAIFRYFIF